MPQKFRLLNEEQVKSLLPMKDLITSMESAIARFSAGEVLQPVRTVLTVGPSKAYYGLMPAYIPQPASMGAKIVTVYGTNAAKGLPSHLATILLFDPDTGSLIGVMDGRYITECRTAAVSAVSVQRLAKKDAATLAIIGSGVQAQSHLEAFSIIRQLKDVRVWSPKASSRETFAKESSAHSKAPVRAVVTAEEAVRGADLIVLVTSSPTPAIDDAWVSPGAHVICVGACRPDQREMDPKLVTRGRVYCDSRAAALLESGDIVMSIKEGRFGPDHVRGELGEVINGKAPGRASDSDITIFKSLGMAVEDVVSADLVLQRAIKANTGTELTL